MENRTPPELHLMDRECKPFTAQGTYAGIGGEVLHSDGRQQLDQAEKRGEQKGHCADREKAKSRDPPETPSSHRSPLPPKQLTLPPQTDTQPPPTASTSSPQPAVLPPSQQHTLDHHPDSDTTENDSGNALTRSCPTPASRGKHSTTYGGQHVSLDEPGAIVGENNDHKGSFQSAIPETGMRQPEELVSSSPTTPVVTPTDELLYPRITANSWEEDNNQKENGWHWQNTTSTTNEVTLDLILHWTTSTFDFAIITNCTS